MQVFFLQRGDRPKEGGSDSAEHNRLTERIARAFCLALCPHLKLLKEDGMAKLGLRVTFESQEVREPPLPPPALSSQRLLWQNSDAERHTGFSKHMQMGLGCLCSCICLYLVVLTRFDIMS